MTAAKKGEKKKLNPGCARVEFIKNIDEIKKLIEDGHSFRNIHRILTERGKITMSYSALYKYINPPKRKLKGK